MVCGKQPDVNASDFFILRYMNINTPRIYSTYTAGQIKSAIEYHPYIGNVTINFPNYNYDNISTACNLWVNETWGGFTVQFDTEWGDLPLFHSATQLNLTVTEVQTGASVSPYIVTSTHVLNCCTTHSKVNVAFCSVSTSV